MAAIFQLLARFLVIAADRCPLSPASWPVWRIVREWAHGETAGIVGSDLNEISRSTNRKARCVPVERTIIYSSRASLLCLIAGIAAGYVTLWNTNKARRGFIVLGRGGLPR